MVYVIVVTEKEDIGEIINRLLGTRHRITVVDDMRTACGCATVVPSPEERASPAAKRMKVDAGPVAKPPPSQPPASINTINSLVVRRPATNIADLLGNGGDTVKEEMIEEETHEDADESTAPVMDASTTHNILMELVANDKKSNDTRMLTNYKPAAPRQRRNNGVPYNPGSLFPGRSGEEEEDEKIDYMEGIDMAVKCMVCHKVIALGTRPANHSTRKYAHARSHGFSDRFECNICQAMFKNKRSIYNHHRTYHDNDPAFRIVDTWSEEAQRELMTMVRTCFPPSNKAFIKKANEDGSRSIQAEPSPDPEGHPFPDQVFPEQPTEHPDLDLTDASYMSNESTMDKLFRQLKADNINDLQPIQ